MPSMLDPSAPFEIVDDFERAIGRYTGAPYVVTTTSCTMALLLACAWHKVQTVNIPTHTYVGVPMSIVNAGGRVTFRDDDWEGLYQLEPYPIWDCARRFTSGMYEPGTFQCVSFHWSKILGIGQAGAILLDDIRAYGDLRQMRFDGRREHVSAEHDVPMLLGWHAYLAPELAASGLMKLSLLPEHNYDLPKSAYPNLSEMAIWRSV